MRTLIHGRTSAGGAPAPRRPAARTALFALALLLAPWPAAAELLLPAGFTAQVYVTGEGFDTDASRGVRGFPSSSTLTFDHTGALYLARSGRRYIGGEVYDRSPLYRIPVGGARLTPDSEARYFYGPPLPNPQVAGTRRARELLVTTFDRERRIGALYRMIDGRAELFAGGTPERGLQPVMRQPEGVAVDSAGNVYVADRTQGLVIRLDGDGRVVDPRYYAITRPRLLAVDDGDRLWVGSDGNAEAPIQPGPGEIVQLSPQGAPGVVHRGPVPAGFGLSPTNRLFVADRHEKQIFIVAPDGKRVAFASFTENDAPRGLCFAPITPETKRAGVAGDLFVIMIRGGAWPVNEVVRISGPFDDFAGQR
jgi:NHL repeat